METDNTGAAVIHLPKKITIREISPLHATLMTLYSQQQPIVIDCSEVEQSDLSIVQLLIAARRPTRSDAPAVRLVLPASGPLAAQIRLVGLEHEFMHP